MDSVCIVALNRDAESLHGIERGLGIACRQPAPDVGHASTQHAKQHRTMRNRLVPGNGGRAPQRPARTQNEAISIRHVCVHNFLPISTELPAKV